MTEAIKQFVTILVTILWIAIIARVILSWLPMRSQGNPLVAVVYQVTEPILAPLRRIIPRLGMFDLSPMIAILILFVIQRLVNSI